MTNDNELFTIVLELNDDTYPARCVAASIVLDANVDYRGSVARPDGVTSFWTTHRFVGPYNDLLTVAHRWLYGAGTDPLTDDDRAALPDDLAGHGVTLDAWTD